MAKIKGLLVTKSMRLRLSFDVACFKCAKKNYLLHGSMHTMEKQIHCIIICLAAVFIYVLDAVQTTSSATTIA